MSAHNLIYTRDENGDLFAVNPNYIISLRYDADELILKIAPNEEIIYDGDEAIELLEQLIPDAVGDISIGDTRLAICDLASVTDNGSACRADADQRAQMIALLDEIEQIKSCCLYLLRRNDGKLDTQDMILAAAMKLYEQLLECCESAHDWFGYFEDRTAADEQEAADIDADELTKIRALRERAYDLAARLFETMRCIKGGHRAIADLLIAQAEALIYSYCEDAIRSFDADRWKALRSAISAEALDETVKAAAKTMIKARREYFCEQNWSAAALLAREALEQLIESVPVNVPFQETITIVRRSDARRNKRDRAIANE